MPTVWLGLLAYLEQTGKPLTTLKRVLIGGSACPRAMTETFERNYGVTVLHAWGMTEMSPVGTVCSIKPDLGDLRRRRALRPQGEAGLRRPSRSR